MKFKAKCMFLGSKEIHSKEGKTFKTISLLDLDNQSSYVLFVTDDYLQKIKDYKLYQSYDFDFSLSVGNNKLLRLSVI